MPQLRLLEQSGTGPKLIPWNFIGVNHLQQLEAHIVFPQETHLDLSSLDRRLKRRSDVPFLNLRKIESPYFLFYTLSSKILMEDLVSWQNSYITSQ